jgi:hypothetical protein
MGSLVLHSTSGDFLRKPSLQSKVDSAASMLPWKVKKNIDIALDTIKRKRLADLENSSKTFNGTTADCKSDHSFGIPEFVFDSALPDKITPLRTFWVMTSTFNRSIREGFNAFHNMPSNINLSLLIFKHNADATMQDLTDLNTR